MLSSFTLISVISIYRVIPGQLQKSFIHCQMFQKSSYNLDWGGLVRTAIEACVKCQEYSDGSTDDVNW